MLHQLLEPFVEVLLVIVALKVARAFLELVELGLLIRHCLTPGLP